MTYLSYATLFKANFCQNAQYPTNLFNSEVNLTWISSGLLKVKLTFTYFLFFGKDFDY